MNAVETKKYIAILTVFAHIFAVFLCKVAKEVALNGVQRRGLEEKTSWLRHTKMVLPLFVKYERLIRRDFIVTRSQILAGRQGATDHSQIVTQCHR